MKKSVLFTANTETHCCEYRIIYQNNDVKPDECSSNNNQQPDKYICNRCAKFRWFRRRSDNKKNKYPLVRTCKSFQRHGYDCDGFRYNHKDDIFYTAPFGDIHYKRIQRFPIGPCYHRHGDNKKNTKTAAAPNNQKNKKPNKNSSKTKNEEKTKVKKDSRHHHKNGDHDQKMKKKKKNYQRKSSSSRRNKYNGQKKKSASGEDVFRLNLNWRKI